MNKLLLKLMLPLLLLLGSCEKELPNPNAATQDAVLKDVDGLLGLVVGVKKEYSVGATSALYNMVSCNGLTTKELFVINTGNGELTALETGKSTLGNSNAVVRNLFTSLNLVKSYAQQLIDNSGNIGDADIAAYVKAYGYYFRGVAIANMAQFWEQVPIEVVTGDDFLTGKRAVYVSRTDALKEAERVLALALNVPATVPAYFATKVGNDINLVGAVHAARARVAIMSGDLILAKSSATAALAVTAKSVWKYETLNPNPVYRISLVTNNTYNGVNNFGLTGSLAPNTADGRIAFYLGANPATNVKVTGFFAADATPIPVYLPGEMHLILAEAHARASELPDAITALNNVLTKNTDPYMLNANLPIYNGAVEQAAILEAIYQNRCIEMYMSGMKLEDSRRFGRPGPNDTNAERNRNWYPYPVVERDNNPNTPTDPAI